MPVPGEAAAPDQAPGHLDGAQPQVVSIDGDLVQFSLHGSELHSTARLLHRTVRAEIRKAVAPGGFLPWLITAAALGIVGAAGVPILTLDPVLRRMLGLTVAASAEVGMSLGMLALAVGAAAYVTREITHGTVMLAKMLVPRMGILFAGRAIAWALFSSAAGLVVALAGVVAGLVSPHVWPSEVWVTVVQVVVAAIACGVASSLVFMAGHMLQPGAHLVAVVLLVVAVVPLAMVVLPTIFPSLEVLAATINSGLIGNLIVQASTVPEVPADSWWEFGAGWLGVALWGVAITIGSFVAFRRSSLGEV